MTGDALCLVTAQFILCEAHAFLIPLLRFIGLRGSQRPDCVAGHEGLELGNVIANYPFESPRRFSGPRRILTTETIRV
jgi:hypothetical protein